MWLKKNGNSLFEKIMTTFDKAKFCKITGMFLLNKNFIMTEKKNVG